MFEKNDYFSVFSSNKIEMFPVTHSKSIHLLSALSSYGLLNVGTVPSYYREVHQAICSRTDERVPISVFQRVLSRTSLSITVQNQVRLALGLRVITD